MNRLAPPYGHRIDRSQPIRFSFEEETVDGFLGDSIASALAASGRWMLSRSFKYHRPRGPMSMAGHEANTLVQIGDEPNCWADLTAAADGMMVRAQNVKGTLHRDRNAILDRFGFLMPPGFYYRIFIGPTRNAWRSIWEPMIRRNAGLGVVDPKALPKSYHQSHLHCDLLIVGAGPAGLSAASHAAAAGADVLLVDEATEVGGSLTYMRGGGQMLAKLRASTALNIRTMTGTTCTGWFEDNWLSLMQGRTLHRVRATQIIFATGAMEQPAIFRNNDLPGVMLSTAAQRLMRHYAVRPGERAVILTSNQQGYRAALDLLEAGVAIAAIVDPRSRDRSDVSSEELRRHGIEILSGGWIDEAYGTKGNRHLRTVRVADRQIPCDTLLVAIGSAPAWQLPCQAGARLTNDHESGRLSLTKPSTTIELAGAVNGCFGLEAACTDGERAASAALQRLGISAKDVHLPPGANAATEESDLFFRVMAHPKQRDFVDFDEDLQVKDLQVAVAEGYRDIELVKRFTTLGMGPSQGRHSAPTAARIVANATECTSGMVGITTVRPPFRPEYLGALAGNHRRPERRSPLHQTHLRLEGRMRLVNSWWRPAFYGHADQSALVVAQEIQAVREGAGIFDVSPLGKIEIRGDDAGVFLDRLYTMSHADQPIGRTRYCLMLSETGAIIDDGVAFRLAKDRFYVTTTTGAISRVHTEMLFWNTQWRLDVDILNLTNSFGALNITGPYARSIVARLESDIDFDAAAFKYLDGRQGHLAGVPVLAMRIGFTGEASYEFHCPASLTASLWDSIMAAGSGQGLRPYGLEASRTLRLEKGHILIGQDTDAMTTPQELGFDWAVSKKKSFFVGKRSIDMRTRFGLTRRLVGLRFPEGLRPLPYEGCLVLDGATPVGVVTSVGDSPTLGHAIGLAYVRPQDARDGAAVTIRNRDGRFFQANVVLHAFVDPKNTRQSI